VRVEYADIGSAVGAMVVDTDGAESVALVDPALSTREQVVVLAELLTDAEFDELVPPLLHSLRSAAVR
jgi:hypothetical protein